MNGSPKQSRAAKILKGLKSDQKISSEEDLLASLPPGSHIQPGPYGGITIVIPHPQGFMAEIPDFQGPWAKIQTEIYRFGVLAGCDGKTPMPRARTVSKKINAACDQWINEFYAETKKDRWNKPVPKEIAPWLVARGTMAGMHVAMEETHGMSVPRTAVETYVRMLLIDDWNAIFQHHWHGNHPDASALSE